MALSSKVVSINAPASTGNQGYTGVGFQPKALMVFATSTTSDDSSTSNYRVGWGIATGSGEQYSSSSSADDAAGTSNTRRATSTNLIYLVDGSGTTVLGGSLVSLDADGFTINWTTALSGARVKVLCLGGSDISSAKAMSYSSPNNTTGSVNYTGVGFQPKVIIHSGGWASDTPPAQQSNANPAIGAAVASGSQWSAAWFDEDNQGTTDVDYIQDAILVSRFWTTGIQYQGTLTGVGSDGFTINWTTASGSPDKIYFLCLAGNVNAKAGSFTRQSGTGTQGVTGVGFTPNAGLFVSLNSSASDGSSTAGNVTFSAGVVDSAGGAASLGARSDDAAGTSNSDSISSTNRLLRWPASDGATFTSWDSDGYTVNWQASAAGTEKVWYLVFGTANTAPTFSVQPSTNYNSGLTRTSVDNTPVSVVFTANDSEQTGSNALSYEIRTSATPGAGTLVGSGTCTHNSSKSHSLAYNASGLSVGSNTLYVHVTDGTNTTTSNSFTVLRDDGTAPTYSVTPNVTTNPVIFGSTYALSFTASDTYSTASNELKWELRTGTSGGGTLIQSGNATSGANNTPTITDSSLNPDSLTRYFRIRDGGGTWSSDTTLNIAAKAVDSGTVAGGENAVKVITLQQTTTYSVTFTATDAASTSSNELYYQIRTGSSGGGTLLDDGGPFTSGATVTSDSFNDTGLANGANTRYLRIRDGAGNWSDFSFTVYANLVTEKSDSDSGAVAGAEASTVLLTGADSGAVAGADSGQIGQTEDDSGAVAGADSATIVISLNDSGTVAGAETQIVGPSDVDSGTVAGDDTNDVVAEVDAKSDSDSGTVSGAEDEDIFITDILMDSDSGTVSLAVENAVVVETEFFASDTDDVTVYGLEEFDLTAIYTVSDSGTVAGAENASVVTIIFPGLEDSGVVAASEDAEVLLIITAYATINIENPVSIAEEASDQALDIVLYPNEANIDDALEGRYGPRREQNKMYLVDKHGYRYSDITTKVLQGNITVNRNEQVSRNGTFVFKDLEGIDLVNQFLMPVYILTINGIDVEFEQGIFEGTVPARSYTEKHSDINVIANDLSITLVKNKFTYPYTVHAGSEYIASVIAIANLAGINYINIPPSTHLTPNDFTWSPETSYMVALNDLLQGINYLPAYFSRKGQLTSRPRSFLSERTPEVTYTTIGTTDGTRIVLEPFDTSFNQSELKNQTVIQVNDPLRNPFWSIYYVENPISPIVLPLRYAMSGWSTTSYLYSPALLDPTSLVEALPQFPNSDFPFGGGAVSFGGWVYLDEADTNTQIGGMWEGSTNKSFLLRSSGSNNGLPEFVVSGNGTSEVVVSVPLDSQPQDGWHHIMGVFNPGGLLSNNLVTNGSFQDGLQAPGSNWAKDLSSNLGSVLTLNASNPGTDADHPTNTRSLDIASTATSTNQTLTIYQDVKAGFMPGHKISVDFRRYFYAKTATNGSATFTIKALDADLNVLATMFTVNATSTDGGWTSSNPTLSSIDVPVGTVILRIYIQHASNSSSSGTINCRWDNITIKDALAGELSIYVDGVLEDTETAGLPTGIYQGTSKMRIGWTGYPGTDNPHTGKITGMALYYGALTATDVQQLYDGLWPTNVPYCLAYWHFDTDPADPLADETARGFTLLPVPGHSLVYQDPAGILRSGLGDRDRFKAVPDVINFPRVKDQTQADILARIIAEDNSSQYLLGTLNTTLDPRRDLNEVYQLYIVDAEGNVITDRKWIVDGWSAELKTAGRMSHQIRRVESY